MKQFIKRVLASLLMPVAQKAIRLLSNADHEYFDYDERRFARFSGAYSPVTKGKLLAKLIKEYHVVEKGLTMPCREPGHGLTAVKNLIASLDLYKRNEYDLANPQFVHAVGVLKEYASKSCKPGEFPDLDRICAEYPTVPPAEQLHFTFEEFYSNNESSFPKFAASRHTVRNFKDIPVSSEKITKAVECAILSPSACNRQYVRVHVSQNDTTIKRILELQGGSRGFGHLSKALLIVTADLQGVGSIR